ncbi:helix-turn-helix domain-containing protein [Pedobacter punctiformis]|uniref:Helix-turn-helix domain-containing protein n=1 Tax=Pedobacter punctiformis TaxID=3004097 RepID=A0ABT4L8M5_9SPHI|nr:helix-turn-helix domain-containing protein [Pedobacter sp. HCMS5-2]MCZ4244279.1 helix-turn-helix domain-containing protein [Pedobacter sp. HCMS5-2]
MNTSIVPVQHPLLKAYVQYFIFFNHDSQQCFSYQTFPNTNLCLALYKNNKIDYKGNKDMNLCSINVGRNTFSSRLLGFHNQPLKVEVNSTLDQICILFHPGGLREFTSDTYGDLLKQEDVFDCIFGKQTCILEEIFECHDMQQRGALLEGFLASKLLARSRDWRTQSTLDHINKTKGGVTICELSKSLKINESTLYRSFKDDLGQGPKYFIQTVRFRAVLNLLLEGQYTNLTELAYRGMFYDQSHFIKDFKLRSGTRPNTLNQNIKLEQRLLAWVTNAV